MPETFDEIQAQYRKFQRLPQKLQEVILSEETAATIARLTEEHHIKGKTSALADLVGDVLMGELHPNLLVRTIAEDMRVPQGDARRMGIAIAEKIFAPVREELLSMYLHKKPVPPEKQPPKPQLQPQPQQAPPPQPEEGKPETPSETQPPQQNEQENKTQRAPAQEETKTEPNASAQKNEANVSGHSAEGAQPKPSPEPSLQENVVGEEAQEEKEGGSTEQ